MKPADPGSVGRYRERLGRLGKVNIKMMNAMRLDSKHIAEKRINPTSRTMGAKPPKEHTGRCKKDEMSKGRFMSS